MRAFGKYRLVEPIASGGMAEVWRAEAPGAAGFVKEVALKLIRGDHDARSDFVEMFIREARLASRLAHGNIVQVFDFDQVDGRYYIAMELVRGRTLRAVVDRCRAMGVRFGLPRAVHVAAEIARALAYAHRAEHGGLVHRDVSPQNVLLSFEGEVKLADFGIARVLGATDVTSPGTVKGKLAYMAPEQARGGAVDVRADVFSLGVILWELCTGRRLFARDSDAAMLAAVIAPDPIAAPSSWNEAVPPELDEIVLGALTRDPESRTASAEVLAGALAAMRMRLASTPEDLDLRVLLARLWPDGDVSVTPTPADVRVTEVRAPPAAARIERPSCEIEAAAPSVAEPEARGEGSAPGPAAVEPLSEAATRTSVDTARRRRVHGRIWVASVLVSATAAMALGGHLVRARSRSGAAVSPIAPETVGVQSTALADPPDREAVSAAVPELSAALATGEAPPPEHHATGPAPASHLAAHPQPPSSTIATSTRRDRAPRRSAPKSAVVDPGESAAPPTAEPRAETGTVAIRAVPWAFVRIDGEDQGETPFEAAVTARTHRLHVHHPTLGDDEIVVTLRPGERYVWQPRLSRP